MTAALRRGVNGLLHRTIDRYLDRWTRRHYVVFGDRKRLQVHHTTRVYGAHVNTSGGTITICPHVSFGPGVIIVTGTHDMRLSGLARQRATVTEGRDVVIEAGAWIAAGAIVIGPCRIGANAVVAAGAVVTRDVAPANLVAGVPARVQRVIDIAEN